jgi:hypothetical protein
MSRTDQVISNTAGLIQFNGGGTVYTVQSNAGDLYQVYIDSGSDVVYKKSTDNGYSWGNPIVVFAGTATALAVWFDRWSNIAAGLIHCAYIDGDGWTLVHHPCRGWKCLLQDRDRRRCGGRLLPAAYGQRA